MIEKMEKIKKEKIKKIEELKIDFGFENEMFFSQFWKNNEELKRTFFKSMKQNYEKFISDLRNIVAENLDENTLLGLLNKEIIYALENFPGFDDRNVGNRIYFEFLTNKVKELRKLINEIKPNLEKNLD